MNIDFTQIFSNFLQALQYDSHNIITYTSVLFVVLGAVFYLFYASFFRCKPIRNALLLIFSLYFYYKLSGPYVLLLIAIATTDFVIGWSITKVRKPVLKTFLLILSIVIDIGVLGYFKYCYFFQTAWIDLFGNGASIVERLIPPIGISYFIFKSLTYTIDIKMEMIDEPEKNYFSYLLYVSFFPNIMAGPITKARDLLPQINSKLVITKEYAGKGFFYILTGLFKKIVIANTLSGNFIQRVFDTPLAFTGFEVCLAVLVAMLWIYYDFCGYTDIVVGIADLLGFEIQHNFREPFKAQNITDFWRRWHISFSTWLNEYLYMPINFGLRRLKRFGTIIAIFITFLISGIWHGAALAFILWGISHGIAIAYDILTKKMREKVASKTPRFLYVGFSQILTYIYLSLTVVFFMIADERNPFSLGKAGDIYTMIFTQFDISMIQQWIPLYMTTFLTIIIGFLLHIVPQSWTDKVQSLFIQCHWTIKILIIFIVFFGIFQAYNSEAMPFIYLEF